MSEENVKDFCEEIKKKIISNSQGTLLSQLLYLFSTEQYFNLLSGSHHFN
jgi:hypothetical protein